jgi:16S rRNA (cytosine1402-N4)-methyltransferase
LVCPSEKAVRRTTKSRSKALVSNAASAGKSKAKAAHVSVLLAESVDFLRPTPPNIYIDGTLGAGGHTKKLAQALSSAGTPGGKLFSFDCDQSAFVVAKPILDQFPEIIVPVVSRFSRMQDVLEKKHGFELSTSTPSEPETDTFNRVKPGSVDGILLDLGVSSMQLDQKDRGFAYRLDGPLDMRMDQNAKQATAADYLNKLNVEELTILLAHFGIHKMGLSSKIALGIVEKRKEIFKFETTKQLLELLEALFPMGNLDLRKKMIKSTFQAFRIMVNDEVHILECLLRF